MLEDVSAAKAHNALYDRKAIHFDSTKETLKAHGDFISQNDEKRIM